MKPLDAMGTEPRKQSIQSMIAYKTFILAMLTACYLTPLTAVVKKPPPLPYQDLENTRCWDEKLFLPWVRHHAAQLRKAGKFTAKEQLLREATRGPIATTIPLAPAEKKPLTPTAIAAKLRASTVFVIALNKDGKDNYGSGFAIADDLILTNWHCCAHHPDLPDLMIVDHDARVIPVTAIVASDDKNDLACLRISGKLTPLPIATQFPTQGQAVWQMGHSHMALWSFTEGKIMRHCMETFTPDGSKKPHTMAVTDVSNKIAKGSSGSAIVDDHGHVNAVYFRSRWYYQEEHTELSGPDDQILRIKDRYVLHKRDMAIPLPTLRKFLKL